MTKSSNDADLVPSVFPVGIGSSQLVLEESTASLSSNGSSDQDFPLSSSNGGFVLENSAINIENSTGVTVGNSYCPTFNEQVIIYQNVYNAQEAIAAGGAINDNVKFNSGVKLVRQDTTLDNDERKHRKSKKTIALSLLLSLVVICTCAIPVTLVVLNQKHDAVEVSTSTTSTTSTTPGDDGTIHIYLKDQWGGLPARNYTDMAEPAPLVIVKDTGGSFCEDFFTCSHVIQTIQLDNMYRTRSPDIWYNFLIGGDGNVYLGRGWRIENEGRKDSIDICYVGNFSSGRDKPSEKMMRAGVTLLKLGVGLGGLSSDYIVVNHNQTADTSSPGENIYGEVAKWPRFFNGTIKTV